VLLNLLHGALRVERVEKHARRVQSSVLLDGLAGIFWRAAELQRFGCAESGREADLLHFVRVDLYHRPQQLSLNASTVRRTEGGYHTPLRAALEAAAALPFLSPALGFFAPVEGRISISAERGSHQCIN